MKTVGLIPAAGQGTRLSPLPVSKELFPVGFSPHPEHGEPHPKVVSQYLLEMMQQAGVEDAYFIVRKGKWDIPAYFGDGSQLNLNLAYLIMNLPYGTPFTLDQAFSFVKNYKVAFGFPDILVQPVNAFQLLLQHQEVTKADVVLGLFKVLYPYKWDMVSVEPDGAVKQIVAKPSETSLIYGWALATWGPAFTAFMHEHLAVLHSNMQAAGEYKEVSIGAVIQAAIDNGLSVQSVLFEDGDCLDIGTPEDLQRAMRSLI